MQNGDVDAPQRLLQRIELRHVLGVRALQLLSGHVPLCKLLLGLTDSKQRY